MLTLSPYVKFEDDRGGLFGITQEQWSEANYIETKASHVRGGHYHKETRELFFIISGELDIAVTDLRSGKNFEFVAGKGDIFVIEPYELHTFSARTDASWINMLSKSHDPENPDFHRLGDN